MSNLKSVENDQFFEKEMLEVGNGCVVIDFHATWCGPCKAIAPHYASLAAKNPGIRFLKVDVDKCRNAAARYNITAMPTFIVIYCKNTVLTLKGGNPANMESINNEIQKYADATSNKEECVVSGYVNLNNFIVKNCCECLNESDKHTINSCFEEDHGYLESDCDEQVIINIPFNQPVRLHSLIVKGPKDNGPKTIKIFVNQTHTLDFDKALSNEAVQTLDVTQKDLKEGNAIPLKYVKFQNVQNILLFVKDNQTDQEVTRIDSLQFIGLPVSHTNMTEFKRVAGQKGEIHVGM